MSSLDYVKPTQPVSNIRPPLIFSTFNGPLNLRTIPTSLNFCQENIPPYHLARLHHPMSRDFKPHANPVQKKAFKSRHLCGLSGPTSLALSPSVTPLRLSKANHASLKSIRLSWCWLHEKNCAQCGRTIALTQYRGRLCRLGRRVFAVYRSTQPLHHQHFRG